jgi:proteic killer suppression protein
MIKSFKNKGLADLFHTGKSAKVQPKHLKKLNIILTMLNAATSAGQMAAPGMRFHPLKSAGRYAVWVDENYRVTFAFEGNDATGVDYEDYH